MNAFAPWGKPELPPGSIELWAIRKHFVTTEEF